MAATPDHPIVLYDIPSSTELRGWSPNVWKTRLLLNYKDLPYQTKWISYPDIAPTFEKLGIKPTGVKPDGSPHYTCPSIIDPTSPDPTPVSNSTPIALYIQEKYPNAGPNVFPEASKAAQLKFIESDGVRDVYLSISSLVVSEVPGILDPRSAVYYHTARSATRGKPLENVCIAGSEERAETWETLTRGLDAVAKVYDENTEGGGEYFSGRTITYADIFLAALFIWARIPTDRDADKEADSVWGAIAKLHGGRWAKFMEKFEGLLQVK